MSSKPGLYKCKSCGTAARSADSGPILTKIEKDSRRLIEQKCTCGGTFEFRSLLNVFTWKDKPPRFRCTVCNAPFRQVTINRIVCSSCPAIGFVHPQLKQVWFDNDQFSLVEA